MFVNKHQARGYYLKQIKILKKKKLGINQEIKEYAMLIDKLKDN